MIALAMHPLEKILRSENNTLLALSVRGALWVASVPYQFAVYLRNAAFSAGWIKAYRPIVPVISIGNLTAGGTGKTPACVYVARWFRDRDLRLAILSRGYKALEDGANDEARELESLLPDVPHLQSPNRSEVAQIAVEELEMQVLLLDDGFQHRRLQRDLDIVLLDATNPFGWGYTLPRGLLREPLAALRRADLVMVTRCDLIPPQELTAIRTKVQRIHPKAAWVESVHRPIGWKNSAGERMDLDAFNGKQVVALCAIGNPTAFHQTLEKMGLQIADRITYPDHHPYNAEDIEQIVAKAQQQGSSVAIVCTGKDLAKLASSALGGIPLWALEVELQIVAGEAVLGEYLDRIYQAASEIGDSETSTKERDDQVDK